MARKLTAYDIEQISKEELEELKKQKKLKLSLRDTTKVNFHRSMEPSLKKFLFDIYTDLIDGNFDLLYEFDYYTPASETIYSIASSEPAQKIVSNYFDFAINLAQATQNKRDFIDLRSTKEYYSDCLHKCQLVFFTENDDCKDVLTQPSILEDDEPIF